MALGVWNLEWLNANAGRQYPISQDASGKDLSDSFELPEEFIVDLYLQIPVDMNVLPGKFFIRNIGNYSTGFSVVIAYDAPTGPINVASTLIARAAHTLNKPYRLGGLGDFEDANGVIVIGDLEKIDLQPTGFFEFDLDRGRLEAEVIRPQIRGISALVAVNGADRSERMQYTVELVAGTNFRITAIPGDVNLDILPQIRFDAIEGFGLVEDCLCEDTGLGPPIRTINGVPGDILGNFTMLGSPCLDIDTITNGLQLADTCSQPCCGCEELEKMTEDLDKVLRGARTLEVFVGRLEASVFQTDQVILGSRLNDRGCFEP